MTITEFSERLKTVKVKDTEILFRTPDRVTLALGGMYYGVKDNEGTVSNPQVGEEPNCIVVQVAPIE